MTTVAVNLSTSAYVQVNNDFNPLLLQSLRDAVNIVFSNTQPAVDNNVYHTLSGSNQYLDIPKLDTNVWALATTNRCSLIATPMIQGSTDDPWMKYAIDTILSDYGDNVSVSQKAKVLIKYGRSDNVGTSTEQELQVLPAGVIEETYLTDNLINSIVSTDAADTQEIVVEGHTIDGSGNFTFVVQTVTLTGQTAAALTTPLARVTRAYNNGSTELLGTVSVTETDTYTAGVPNTPSKVHLQIRITHQQSEKAGTTISQLDYWIITGFRADVLEKTAAYAEIDLEVRLKGKVFRTRQTIAASSTSPGVHEFKPYLIIPKNSDVRLTAIAGAANTTIAGSLQGVLALII